VTQPNRELARKNVRTAIVLALMAVGFFALFFIAQGARS